MEGLYIISYIIPSTDDCLQEKLNKCYIVAKSLSEADRKLFLNYEKETWSVEIIDIDFIHPEYSHKKTFIK